MTTLECSINPRHFTATYEDRDVGASERVTVTHLLLLVLTVCPVCKNSLQWSNQLELVKD